MQIPLCGTDDFFWFPQVCPCKIHSHLARGKQPHIKVIPPGHRMRTSMSSKTMQVDDDVVFIFCICWTRRGHFRQLDGGKDDHCAVIELIQL